MIIALMLTLAGCGGSEKTPECIDNGGCPEGQACLDSQCKEVECLASNQCDLYNFCNPNYKCQEGCESDADCRAGQTCDTTAHSCESYGCRSAALDCNYGEFCNTDSGDCFSKGEVCKTCNAANPYSCGSGAYCLQLRTGGDGYCFNFCDSDRDCPRGFECVELGAPYENVCVGDCDFMVEGGYL